MLTLKPWLLVSLLCAHVMLQTEANDINLANHKLSGLIQWKYEKRPFCNAFTGCGKKRSTSSNTGTVAASAYPPYALLKRNEMEDKTYNNNNNNNEEMSEGLSDLIDINAEPAVENVQKQIMSQAKIFEAIKEASKEIFRQKNRQRLRHEAEKLEDAENA